MVTKENVGGVFTKIPEYGVSKKDVIFLILGKYRNMIPQDVWDISSARINKAFEEFNSEKLKGTATSAFFVHTRRHRGEDTDVTSNAFSQLDDSTRCLPILDPKYGIQEKEVEAVWGYMPAFKVGEVIGVLDGKEIKCAIISVPITPEGLESWNDSKNRMEYARNRISQAAGLARRMGAKTIGLGETLAALTRHGKVIQSQFPDIKITTGHAFTVAFMNEITKQTARDLGHNLKDLQVTVIGAHGSIGSAMTEMLLRDGAMKLRLHDKKDRVNALEKRRMEILRRYSDAQIEITGGNGELKEACKGSGIVLVASSAPEPFIKREHLDPHTVVINDAQPPGITLEEAIGGKSKTIWVVGKLPDGLSNTFDCGLIRKGEWTCLLETIATDAGKSGFGGTGSVDQDKAEKGWKSAIELGMGVAPYQSWGESVDISPGIFA